MFFRLWSATYASEITESDLEKGILPEIIATKWILNCEFFPLPEFD